MSTTLPSKKQQSLCRQILTRVSLLGALFVVVATILCYYQVNKSTRNAKLDHLRQYMRERSRHDNGIFTKARKHLEFFRKEFLSLYLSDLTFSEEDFRVLFEVDNDGATRMKKEFFDEHFDSSLGRQWGRSGFIGNNQSTSSPDFQRRLLVSSILVNRYGPAWWPDEGLHVTYPENAIVIFYPTSPWGLEAKPDLPMNELGTIKATLQSENPERHPVWTSLYYDETAGDWTITYEVPVDYQGRHLCNPSLDVHLEEIMNHLVTEHPEGAYNFIIRTNGDLVAHPGELREDQKWKGQLSLDEIADPEIVRMYHLLQKTMSRHNKGIEVIEDPPGNNYLMTFHIPGPDWWFVMVYPKHLIDKEAHQSSRIVLFLGLSLFVSYFLVIFLVIDRQVRTPLQHMLLAVSLVADKQYDELVDNPEILPLDSKNEIGQLANAFKDMAKQVQEVNQDLENIVESRTHELEQANARLRDLSLLDGLTGIHNRRSFDRDLEIVFSQAKNGVGSFALMLADVDSFKKFNDTYGHTAGDEALRRIARQLADNIRHEDRVYRYGGEEFAIIFNTPAAETTDSIGQNLLDMIRQLNMPHSGSPHGIVTISAGICPFQADIGEAVELIKAADNFLYRAKSLGGNCLGNPPLETEH